MAINLSRTGQLALFSDLRTPNLFLSRMFTMKPGGNYAGDKVFLDVQRHGENVAVAIRTSSGPNLNTIDEFTTKEFTPPAYGEAFPIDVASLLNRMAGVDPHTAAYQGYAGHLVSMMMQGFVLIDNKIKRAVELQASQILQTATLSLTNKDGDTIYDLDFKPKATHYPTAGVPWATVASANPLDDLGALADIIRTDGKVDPDRVVMGRSALSNFLKNDDVQKALDIRRMLLAEVAPQFADSGATFYGHVWVGTYRLEIWAYPDTYQDPATGNPTRYVGDDNVIMTSSRTRLDMTSAQVPLPIGPDPRVAGLLPGRMTSRANSFDVTPNVYCSPNGKQIMGELESRPLLIPVQIDGMGCLNTGS